MNVYLHIVAQAILNLVCGFIWGSFLCNRLPKAWIRPVIPMYKLVPMAIISIWLTLMVFVSIRTLGDLIFQQPTGTFLEAVALYSYATAFFIGYTIPIRNIINGNFK